MVVAYACCDRIINSRAFHSHMSRFGDNVAIWCTGHMTSETVWPAPYPFPALDVLRERVGLRAGSGKNMVPGWTGV